MLKGARWGALHIWLVCSWRLFLEILHWQIQSVLKRLFMELGMPWHLGIWMRQRTLVLLCCYSELGPSNWWKMDGLKCFRSVIYTQYTVMKVLIPLWQSRLFVSAFKNDPNKHSKYFSFLAIKSTRERLGKAGGHGLKKPKFTGLRRRDANTEPLVHNSNALYQFRHLGLPCDFSLSYKNITTCFVNKNIEHLYFWTFWSCLNNWLMLPCIIKLYRIAIFLSFYWLCSLSLCYVFVDVWTLCTT